MIAAIIAGAIVYTLIRSPGLALLLFAVHAVWICG
jgi:hypothetical protein